MSHPALKGPAQILHRPFFIDYATPVTQIQLCLARMRLWRVRVGTPVMVLLGSFVWIPVLLMLIQIGFDRQGIDYRGGPKLVPWFAVNGVFALALAWLAYWLLRRFGHVRWLQDNFAGRAIARAQAELDEIRRFESD